MYWNASPQTFIEPNDKSEFSFLELPVGSINVWGEAFQLINLLESKGYLRNAVAPTAYGEGRPASRNVKSRPQPMV